MSMWVCTLSMFVCLLSCLYVSSNISVVPSTMLCTCITMQRLNFLRIPSDPCDYNGQGALVGFTRVN